MGTPLFTGDVFQWARFCNGLKGGNGSQVPTEIVDIDRLAVPVLKLTYDLAISCLSSPEIA